MAKSNEKMSKKGGWQDAGATFDNPFAALKKDTNPAAVTESNKILENSKEICVSDDWKPKKVNLRLDKKGRGGKQVTLATPLPAPDAQTLETWVKSLRKSLGVGGSVEEGAAALQGDLRERLAEWFEKKGIKVTR